MAHQLINIGIHPMCSKPQVNLGYKLALDPAITRCIFSSLVFKTTSAISYFFSADVIITNMNLILWLMQSCLLSLAIFALLGEELDLDHKQGGRLCERAILVADEPVQQYRHISRCCKLEKFSKWQIPFGLLAVGQTSFLLVIFSLRRLQKSSGLLLPVLCVTSWLLTVIILLKKLVAHFSPEHQTAANAGYIGALCTSVWFVLTAVLAVGFQRIVHIVDNLTANADNREDLKKGVYFCSPEGDKALEGIRANIPCALIVLTVAYFISSCYTLCLVLTHGEVEPSEEKDVKPKGNKRLQKCQKRGDYENDSLDVGGEGEVHPKKSVDLEVTLAPRCCIQDFNKNTVSVGSAEESEDESFVFGWRL